jgi:hypothetical protein
MGAPSRRLFDAVLQLVIGCRAESPLAAVAL